MPTSKKSPNCSDPIELKVIRAESSLETIIEIHEKKLINNIDEKPARSKFQLMRMGTVYFGIEFLFSIEVALAVPILLELKVPEK